MARGPAGAERDSRQESLAYREMVAPGALGLGVGITCALVAMFTLVGPLDTDLTLGWSARAALWSMAGMLDFATWYAGCVLTLFLARFRPPAQVRLALAAMAFVLAGLYMTVTYTLYALFHGGNIPDVGAGRVYLFNLVFVLFLVALTDHVLQLRLKLKRLDADNEHTEVVEHTDPSAANGDDLQEVEPAADGHSAEAQLFYRMPETLGRDVIYLKATGHYIKVTTTAGSALILMRLVDAIDALGDSGMRIHRSYWVAYRHVAHLVRRDRHRRTLLRVTGNHELPVSRSFLADVLEAVSNLNGPSHQKRVKLQQ